MLEFLSNNKPYARGVHRRWTLDTDVGFVCARENRVALSHRRCHTGDTLTTFTRCTNNYVTVNDDRDVNDHDALSNVLLQITGWCRMYRHIIENMSGERDVWKGWMTAADEYKSTSTRTTYVMW